MKGIADILTALALVITACGTLYNVWNIRRIEKNTNSIATRNEKISRALGVTEGKQQEKDRREEP